MTVPIRGVPGPEGLRPQGDTRAIPLGDPFEQGPSFADTLADALGDVSRVQDRTRSTIEDFIRGDREVPLHELMAASEEASLSLELLVEMRNKLTEAYRALMNMQT